MTATNVNATGAILGDSTVGSNVGTVQDIADVIFAFVERSSYMNTCLKVASFLKRSPPPAPREPTPFDNEQYMYYSETQWWHREWGHNGRPWSTWHWHLRPRPPGAFQPPDSAKGRNGIFHNLGPVFYGRQCVAPFTDAQVRSMALKARSNIFGLMDDVTSFVKRARNSGFQPPDNPFIEIARLHTLRESSTAKVPVSEQEASDLIYNIKAYINLLDAEKQNAINFQKGVFNTAQLEHISLSFTGLGGSGNAALDLMRIMPNGDEIRKEKARAALSVLDFSKRLPSVVFTAEYIPNPDKGSMGTLIGFKKMGDASGFIIRRHSIFGNEDVEFEVTNQQLNIYNQTYMEYAKAYALSFYDKLNPASVNLFVDKEPVSDNEFFMYTVQAWQLKKNSTSNIVPGTYSVANMTPQIQETITTSLSASYGENYLSNNPWPAYAKTLLNDESLDWVLSALNVQAAIARKETREVIRSYSYLSANAQFLQTQASVGKLVVAKGVDGIKKSVVDAVQAYGMQQTIESLMSETEILYWFDGADGTVDTHFERAGTLDQETSKLFSAIAGSIDSETMTVNLKSFASNLASVLDMKDTETAADIAAAIKNITAKPVEIQVVDPATVSNSNTNDDVNNTVDLTTFDGISKFIRTIRTMFDIGRNKAPPVSSLPSPAPNPEPDTTLDEKIAEAEEKGDTAKAEELRKLKAEKETNTP